MDSTSLIGGTLPNNPLQSDKICKYLVQEVASPKCPSRAFIMLKFLEAERAMNKKLN
jgi:hypothetical protein